MCNNTTGLENQTRPELNPQRFLRSSPESRVSPRASPNHQISNGPLSKVSVMNRYYYLFGSFAFITNPIGREFNSFSDPRSLPHHSLPSSSSPPPWSLSLLRQKNLPATRTPSNRAATCTLTTCHRWDTRNAKTQT